MVFYGHRKFLTTTHSALSYLMLFAPTGNGAPWVSTPVDLRTPRSQLLPRLDCCVWFTSNRTKFWSLVKDLVLMWFAHMILDQFLWSEKLLIWNARLYEGWVSLRIFMGWIPKREEASVNGRIYFCCVGGWGRAPSRWVLQVGPGSQMTWKGKIRLRKMPWCYPLVNKHSYWKWPFIVVLVYQRVKWGNYNSLQCFVPYDMLLPPWKISLCPRCTGQPLNGIHW